MKNYLNESLSAQERAEPGYPNAAQPKFLLEPSKPTDNPL